MLARRAVLLAVLAAAAAPGTADAATTCPEGASCATIAVPLDHTGATPGTIRVAYSRLPATGEVRKGTIVLLSGGPGQAAIPLTTEIGQALTRQRTAYDLVFVDQRGTGDSGAVKCAAVGDAAGVAACAAKLGAKRAFWNTTETARDLEDLRVALEVPKLILLGVSYGTKVAAEYARRYPARTAAVVLDSPTPVDGLDGTLELRPLAISRMLREVCWPGSCARSVPDPPAALVAAVRRLPVRGPLVQARGKVVKATVTESDLFAALAASDGSPFLRSELPGAIASLARGDAAPLLHALSLGGVAGDSAGVNTARLFATFCIESRFPWAPDSPIASRAAALASHLALRGPAPFAPFKPATVIGASLADVCAAWPPTPAPAGVPLAGPDVPVLVLSGREDLRTPLEDAHRSAGQYPHARLLAVPGVGHSVLGSDASGCALAGLRAFLAGRPVKECSRRRLTGGESALFGAAPYVPAQLAAIVPTTLKGRAGRTLDAFRYTLTGMTRDVLAQFGALFSNKPVYVPGVRGGYSKLSANGWEMHDVERVRGVRISGEFGVEGHADRVVIDGPAAVRSVLAIKDSRLVGTVGGQRVNVRPYK